MRPNASRTGYEVTQDLLLLQATALALSSRAWGIVVQAPLPLKRQPW
jgi:hypothetical protein